MGRTIEDRQKSEAQQAEMDAAWKRVRARIRNNLGETAFRSWMSDMQFAGIRGKSLVLTVPTRFIRDRIASHYAEKILLAWTGETPAIDKVEVELTAPRQDEAKTREAKPATRPSGLVLSVPVDEDEETDDTAGAKLKPVRPPSPADAAHDFENTLDPRFTFANFVVGKPNELAHAAAKRVADNEAVSFNPLFLYGGVGLGKTHLMHAIAWEIKQRHPERRVMYLSAEKFMYQFIRAIRFKDTVAFKEQFRNVDVLMIDDVQFISGKESTQEEFFHTFNALVDQNRQIVLSADKSPSDLDGMEERLKSRLGWGLVADIHPSTYELRLGILQAKAEAVSAKIPQTVLEFLAHRITSNIRELEGALNRLTAHAELVGRPVTLETTQDLLSDLLRANERRVTLDKIKRKTAEHFNIKVSDMQSARRARAIARPRQVAMYLSKQLTQKSLPEIGRAFGGRDHTTVIHAVKKVEELSAQDPAFAEDVEFLMRLLAG